MKRVVKFPSIDQFPKIARDVKRQVKQRNQEKDSSSSLPIIEVTFSEKVHGTHAALCYSNAGRIWVQSRKEIITVEADNAGCALSVHNNHGSWTRIMDALVDHYGIDLNASIIAIFFEWAGDAIQKHSAVEGLEKQAFIFEHFLVTSYDGSSEH